MEQGLGNPLMARCYEGSLENRGAFIQPLILPPARIRLYRRGSSQIKLTVTLLDPWECENDWVGLGYNSGTEPVLSSGVCLFSAEPPSPLQHYLLMWIKLLPLRVAVSVPPV